MKPIFAIILSLALASGVSAQEPVIKVFSDEDNAPLPYTIVKVKGRNIGMMSDSLGVVDIPSQRLQAADTLVISYIGHRSRHISAASLVADSINCVYLASEPLQLPEFTARRKKMKTIRAGKKYASGLITCDFSSPSGWAGETVGHEFHSGKKSTMWLDNVGFYIIESSDMLSHQKFRINIYDMSQVEGDNTDKFVSVLSRPIVFDYDKSSVTDGKFVYKLPELVRLPKDAMVEIEFLGNAPADEHLLYKSNMVGKRNWARQLDETHWCRTPFASPFFIECVKIK